MSAKTKKKADALAVPVPATREGAEELLGSIGQLQREISTIENKMNDKLAVVKAEAEQAAAEFNRMIDAKFKALHAWAEVHRDELLEGGGKTAHLATGDLSWRTTPPSVRVADGKVALHSLKFFKLERFIRTKEEIDKDAILADPKAVLHVKGITVTQREEFVAKPFSSEIERAEPAKVTVSEVKS